MKDDGVHNYVFGGWPEMPWKRVKFTENVEPPKEPGLVTFDPSAVATVRKLADDLPGDDKADCGDTAE